MATKTTIEVPVEEQTVMTEIDSQVNEEQTTIAPETKPSEEIVCDIATLDKEGILARLAEKAFAEGNTEDVAYFEPFYLKDFVVGTAKKSLLERVMK